MIKRLTALLLTFCLIISAAPVYAGAATGQQVTANAVTVTAGNTATVTLQAKDFNNIAALDVYLYYDAQALAVSSTSNGSKLSGAQASVNTSVSGEIKLSAMALEGINGSGTLLTIYFTTRADCTPGTYPITVAIGRAYDGDLQTAEITGVSGSVTVNKPVQTEYFSLSSSVNKSTLEQGNVLSYTVRNSGSRSFVSAEFTVEYDQEVFAFDSVSMGTGLTGEGAVYSVNSSVLGQVRIAYANVEAVSSYALFTVNLRVVADRSGSSTVKAGATNVYREDLTAYLAATTSYTVSLKKLPVVEDHPDAYLQTEELVVGRQNASVFYLQQGSGVAAADFTLTYDPTILRCISVEMAEGLDEKGGMLIVNDNFAEGTIRFSYVNMDAYDETDLALVRITWEPLQSPLNHYTITPSGVGVVDTQQNAVALDYVTDSDCIFVRTVIDPVCLEVGRTNFACTCGEEYDIDIVPMLGHDLVHTEAVAPTCTEIGWNAYDTCNRCGYTTYVEIPALGHDEIYHGAQSVSCLEIGWDGYVTCSRCDYTTYKEIAALGHRTVVGVDAFADPITVDLGNGSTPFTLENGAYYSNNHNHGSSSEFYIRADYDCTLKLICGVSSEGNCDKLYVYRNSVSMLTISGSVTGRELSLDLSAGDEILVRYSKDGSVNNGLDQGWVELQFQQVQISASREYPSSELEPDCTNAVICSYCHTVVKEALGHDEISHAAQAVTCLEIGWDAYVTCARCDYTTYAEIPALGHDEILHSAQAATCTGIGWYDYVTCGRCDYTTYTELSALGHRNVVTDIVVVDPVTVDLGTGGTPFTLVDGVYYSNNHTDNSTSEFYITAQYDCTLELIYGVSSEQNYDKLFILHNGAQKTVISGSYTGQRMTLNLTAGDVVTVRYSKDGSQSNAQDQGWVELQFQQLELSTSWDVPSESLEPDCTNAVVCSYCQSVIKEALGHDEISHAAQAVTCLEIGWDAYVTCARCDYTTYAEIPALGHDEIFHAAQAVTCLEIGWDAYVTCSRCDYTTYAEIPATGHHAIGLVPTLVDPFVIDSAFEYVDGVYYSQNHAHNSSSELILTAQADCEVVLHYGVSSEQGFDKLSVLLNGSSLSQFSGTYTDQVWNFQLYAGDVLTLRYSKDGSASAGEDRAWVSFECEKILQDRPDRVPAEEKAPTCTEPVICCDCGVLLKEALGHNEISHAAQAVTCLEIGWDAYVTCSRCDYTTYAEIPALGHDMGQWEVIVQPGCIDSGTQRSDCTRCDHYETDMIPATGHSFMNKLCTVCGEGQAPDQQWDVSQNGDATVMANAYACSDGTYLLEIVGNGPTKNYSSYSSVFSGLSGKIRDIRILDGVTSIGNYMFCYMTILGQVEIADSVTTIGTNAFYTFSGPRTITLPANITAIGSYAFYGSKNLTIILEGDSKPSSLGSIWDYNCGHYLQPQQVVTTESATYVIDRNGKAWLAKYCGNETAFVAESVINGVPVTGIGAHAFDGKNNLRTYTIPAEITSLGNYAFKDCNNLAIFLESSTLPYNSSSSWYDKSPYYLAPQKIIQSEDALSVVDKDGKLHFVRYWGMDENVIVPAEVDGVAMYQVAQYAFYNKAVRSVVLPNTIEILGGYAFAYTDMPQIDLPEALREIGNQCFYSTSLTTVTIPKNVTRIGSNAFAYCYDLKTVYIGSANIAKQITSATSCGKLCERPQSVVIPASVENSWLASNFAYQEQAYCMDMDCVIYSNCAHSWQETVVSEFVICQTDGIIRYTCENCSVEKLSITKCHDEQIHDAVAATCTVTGWLDYTTCTRCDYSTYQQIPALGHDLQAVSGGAPTCTEDGCNDFVYCNRCDYNTLVILPALGHEMGQWEVTIAATCIEVGSQRRDCGRCDHFETEVIPATGHTYTAVVTAPTCIGQGYTTHTCACGDAYVDGYLPALGHDMGAWKISIAASCTESGSQRRDCARCDHFETEAIPATGHNHTAVVTAPTCTAQGYTTRTCACGDSYKDSYVAALGHGMGAWEITKAATCTEDGSQRSDCGRCDYFETKVVAATGHDWNAGVVTKEPTEETTGLRTYTCQNCSATRAEEIPTLDHIHDYATSVTAPSCTTQGYTTYACRCGDNYKEDYVAALGHDMGAWEIAKAATCTENGSQRRDCARCDHFETEAIPATGHNHAAVVTEPTCTTQGYTTHTCACGDSYKASYIAALGHDLGAWEITKAATCTDSGSQRAECSRCDYYETKVVVATGHSHTAVVTAPTCTAQGYTTHTCACGDAYRNTYVAALGHDMGAWEVTKAATCTEDGSQRRACARCDHFETEAIPATGHNHTAVVTAPTCTAQGYTTHTCACGDSYKASYVDALGHDMGAWEVSKAATCTKDGSQRSECSRCDYFETEEIPAAGHSYAAVVTKPTCTAQGYTTHTCACGDSYKDSYVDALDHDMDTWETTKAATCTESGSQRRDCTRCNHYETEVIPATGHSHTATVTAPTCTAQGYTTHICSCGDSYKDSHVAALGHDLGAWKMEQVATCTEAGLQRRNCTRCDHFETQVIPATGHSHTAVVTAPTCTAQGYTTHTCACGDSYKASYVAALGHDMGAWEVTKAATCTENGSQRTDCSRCDYYETKVVAATGHDWDSGVVTKEPTEETTGLRTYTCQNCSATRVEEIPTLDHIHDYAATATAPTCTAQGYTTHTCSCGDSYKDSYIAALGHDMGAWAIDKAATCTENGSQRRDCARCDHFETEAIPATGHNHAAVVTAPTCTAQGYTTRTCTCGDSYKDSYVAALGHDMGAWETTKAATCSESGSQRRDCTRCDHFETEVLAATGHSYTATVTAPTCTAQGYTTHTCTCGDSYKDSYVAALGHDMGAWAIDKAATCTENGSQRTDCSRCDYYETKVVAATGHDWDSGVVTKEPTEETTGLRTYTCQNCSETRVEVIPALDHTHEYAATVTVPTCTAQGYTTHTCSCGDSYKDSYVAALGHNMGAWEATKAATCTENGSQRRDCARCDHFETEALAATGHQYVETVVKPRPGVQGYTQHLCHCGDFYRTDYVAALELVAPKVNVTVDKATGKPALNWGDDGDGVVYEVYRATSKKGKYTKVATVTESDWLDSSASVGKTYYYKLKAICLEDSSLSSGFGAVVTITAKCATPELSVEAGSAGKPVLTWNKVSGAKKYEIWRSVDGGKFKKLTTVTKTTYTDSKATNGAECTYKVKALASKSSYNGNFSDEVGCYVTCAAPTLTVKIDAATGKPTLSWKKVTGATGYAIYRDGELLTTITAVSYLDTTAKTDSTYSYYVVTIGKSEVFNSLASATKTVTATVGQPQAKGMINENGKPVITWETVEDAVKYIVYRSTKSNKSYKEVATITDLTYTDASVAAGKTYYYKVLAVGENSKSAQSSYVKLTGKCDIPELSVVAGSTGKPVLTWNKVAGARKYEIWRSVDGGKYKKLTTVTKTTYTDSKATEGAYCTYKIKALGSKSSYNGNFSEELGCYVTCAAPTVTVKIDAATGKPTLSWKKVTGATGYAIYRNGELLTTVTALSYADTETQIGEKYSYQVVTLGKAEIYNSAPSKAAAVTATCGQPKVTGKIGETGKPELTWDEVEGATSYIIYRSTSKTKGFKKIGEATEMDYTDTSAKKGKTYYYKVVAVRGNTQSAQSAVTGKLKSKK